MPMRLKIIDLSGFPVGAPFKVVVNCAYWSLRMVAPPGTATMDGVPILPVMATGSNGSGDNTVSIDFPPVFDANGCPVNWNHVLNFNGQGSTVGGCILMTYYDPEAPSERIR